MTLKKNELHRTAVRNSWLQQQSQNASSDLSPEDVIEHAQEDQSFTSLLQRTETTSTLIQSTSEPNTDFYTGEIPEPTQNYSAPEISVFEGPYEFQVRHPMEDGGRASKSASWTYSPMADELYVKMNVDCPLLFKIRGVPPLGTYVRATPIYMRAEDMHNYPKRCLNHSAVDHETNRDHQEPEQLIRCYHGGTGYTKDNATGRMSTILPYASPELGSSLSTHVVRFMCRTSCPGGMNRRPMGVLFTLENNGNCLGRQMRKVKICACPGRDRYHEELRLERNMLASSALGNKTTLAQDVKKACKRIGASLGNNKENEVKQRKVYTLTVHSKTHYNILSALIPILQKNLGKQEDSSEDEA